MGCGGTKCKNCKKSIKACQRQIALDGSSCCPTCVHIKNEQIKKSLK
jgi:hypothetical protein